MSGDLRSLRCKHLCDPHSFLTVTFWLLDNFSSTGGEYHSHLLVSVSHHVTICIYIYIYIYVCVCVCVCVCVSVSVCVCDFGWKSEIKIDFLLDYQVYGTYWEQLLVMIRQNQDIPKWVNRNSEVPKEKWKRPHLWLEPVLPMIFLPSITVIKPQHPVFPRGKP